MNNIPGTKTILATMASHGEVDIAEVKPDVRLEALGFTSLTVVSVLMALQQQIGISFDDDELSTFVARVDTDPIGSMPKKADMISTVADFVDAVVKYAHMQLSYRQLEQLSLLSTIWQAADDLNERPIDQRQHLLANADAVERVLERECGSDPGQDESPRHDFTSDAELIAEGMCQDLDTGDAIDDDDDV